MAQCFEAYSEGGALAGRRKPGDLVKVDIAIARGCKLACEITETDVVRLEEAVGRVLAEPITATAPQPLFDNSAMDGFAVKFSALVGEGPWHIPLGGRIAAGDSGADVEDAGALRILTGAPVPAGFDAVIMQERVQRNGGTIVVAERPAPGENIRRAGEDLQSGQMLLSPGCRLTPAKLALAASAGVAKILVRRKVRIAFFSTGSELRQPGDELSFGQIFNSNRFMLRGLLAAEMIEATDLGALPDDKKLLAAALTEASGNADMVISTGGVSVGDEDHMPSLVREAGGQLHVLNVAMKPGKPVTLGEIDKAIYVGLPGNPVAAFITFNLIARAIIDKLAGVDSPRITGFPAISGFDRRRRQHRVEYVPVRLSGHDEGGLPRLEMLGRGSSAALLPIAQADGLAIVEAGIGALSTGDKVAYLPLEQFRF